MKFKSDIVIVARWWKTREIEEPGYESKFSRCAHRRNIQQWIVKEDRESKRKWRKATVSLCLGKKDMRISRGEAMFYTFEMKYKASNVQKLTKKTLTGVSGQL